MPVKNHYTPGSDPEIDGGHLFSGKAKKSTPISHVLLQGPEWGTDSLMHRWVPLHQPLVNPEEMETLTEMI